MSDDDLQGYDRDSLRHAYERAIRMRDEALLAVDVLLDALDTLAREDDPARRRGLVTKALAGAAATGAHIETNTLARKTRGH